MLSQDIPKRLAILPTGNNAFALNAVLGLCKILSGQDDRTCLVDLSEGGALSSLKDCSSGNEHHNGEVGFDIIRPNSVELKSSRKAMVDVIETLTTGYDRVVIFCPSPDQGTSLSQLILGEADAVVVVAQAGKTTQDAAKLINRLTKPLTNKPTGLVIS